MKKINKYYKEYEEYYIGDLIDHIIWIIELGRSPSYTLLKDLDYVNYIDNDKETWIDPGYQKKKYKSDLEKASKIKCSFCKYNRCENQKYKSYGGYDEELKWPNWKLVSKNKRQWNDKPIKISYSTSRYSSKNWLEIKW